MNEEVEEKTKRCILCDNTFNLDMFQFLKNKDNKNGGHYHSYCRKCAGIKSVERLRKIQINKDLEFSNPSEYGEDNFKCEQCKIIKDKYSFNKSGKSKFGIRRICSKCFAYNKFKIKKEHDEKNIDRSDIEINQNNTFTANQLAIVTISHFNRIDKNHDGYLDAIKKIKEHVDLTLKNIQ